MNKEPVNKRMASKPLELLAGSTGAQNFSKWTHLSRAARERLNITNSSNRRTRSSHNTDYIWGIKIFCLSNTLYTLLLLNTLIFIILLYTLDLEFFMHSIRNWNKRTVIRVCNRTYFSSTIGPFEIFCWVNDKIFSFSYTCT